MKVPQRMTNKEIYSFIFNGQCGIVLHGALQLKSLLALLP